MSSSIVPPEGVAGRPQDEPGELSVLLEFLYSAPIGLIQTTLDGEILVINPLATQLLMPLARHADLSNLFGVLDRFAPSLRSQAAAFDQAEGIVCQSLRFKVPGKPGAEEPVFSITVMKLRGDQLIATLNDVTSDVQREQRSIHRRLRDAARVDSLTGLSNRLALIEQIREAAGACREDGQGEFALLFLNFDRFKQINDLLGHATGNRVLQIAAERLRAHVRGAGLRGETFIRGSSVARIGGDEFVVLLQDWKTRGEIEAVATRLQGALSRPFVVGVEPIACSVSIGIAVGGAATSDPDALLRDSSIAMVVAKSEGGDRCTMFEESMRERVARRAELETDLRRALAAR